MKMNHVLALILSVGFSQVVLASNEGYVVDGRNEIVKSGSGLCWHTGYWTPAMANAECDPQLVKQAPIVAVTEKVSERVIVQKELNADVLFNFDKFNITASGKAELDRVATEIRNFEKVDFVLVIGHADRIGKASYNMTLSKKRANEVRKYLVLRGLDPAVIKTTGVGETQPLTKPGECSGRGAKLKACLAKDRRVEIKVGGAAAR